jgi:hypothetical protein
VLFPAMSTGGQRRLVELDFADRGGPIVVRLPRVGFDRMCGRSVSAEEIDTIVRANEIAFHPLIDRALERCRGYTFGLWQSGVGYRRLDINMVDIRLRGVKLATDVMDTIVVDTLGKLAPWARARRLLPYLPAGLRRVDRGLDHAARRR